MNVHFLLTLMLLWLNDVLDKQIKLYSPPETETPSPIKLANKNIISSLYC